MIRDGGEEEQALTEEQLQNALNGVGAGALGDLLPPDQMAAFAQAQAAAQQQQQAAPSEEGSPSAGSPVSGKKNYLRVTIKLDPHVVYYYAGEHLIGYFSWKCGMNK